MKHWKAKKRKVDICEIVLEVVDNKNVRKALKTIDQRPQGRGVKLGHYATLSRHPGWKKYLKGGVTDPDPTEATCKTVV